MTRDEMIGAISHAIVVGESNYIPSKVTAEAIINTILTALQVPTEEMIEWGGLHIDWPISTWQAILSASPLNGEKK